MKKSIIFVIPLVLIVVSVLYALSLQKRATEENNTVFITREPSPTANPNVDYRAAFTIYTRGTLRIFSDAKYHNRSADVYIASENPNIIVVKKRGVTWKEFFDSLPAPFKLESDCLLTGTGQQFCTDEREKLTFMLNGEEVNDILQREIREGDKLLISFGAEKGNELKEQFGKIPQPSR